MDAELGFSAYLTEDEIAGGVVGRRMVLVLKHLFGERKRNAMPSRAFLWCLNFARFSQEVGVDVDGGVAVILGPDASDPRHPAPRLIHLIVSGYGPQCHR